MKKLAVVLGWLLLLPHLNAQVAAETIDLQKLIDAAPPNTALQLQKGQYKGPVVISKPITIKGEKGVIIEGGKQGDVITIEADGVHLSGLSIQHSGKGAQNAGVLLKKVKKATIHNNLFKHVQYGIFVRGGGNHRFIENTISGYSGHFSTRGNGIHLLAADGNEISGNQMQNVQDGVYLDEASHNLLSNNTIIGSRYAFHFMFSKNNLAESNHLFNNINGIMAMNSSGIVIKKNRFEKHLNYRGFGVLIYETEDVQLYQNELLYNHNGLSLQSSKNVKVGHNLIAGNYIGFITEGKNENIKMSKNNLQGNIVQTKLSGTAFPLDDGKQGNYWDDYHSYDLNGDGIGEIAYNGGSGYSQLLHQYPHLQFYFESPAMNVWQSAEKMFSLQNDGANVDRFPLVEPAKYVSSSYLVLLLTGATVAVICIFKRKRREKI